MRFARDARRRRVDVARRRRGRRSIVHIVSLSVSANRRRVWSADAAHLASIVCRQPPKKSWKDHSNLFWARRASFPTQNEPTGFPMRPRRAAMVSARRQPPARAPRGTSGHVHAAREGWLPVFGFQAHLLRAQCTIAGPTGKQSARSPLYGRDPSMPEHSCP